MRILMSKPSMTDKELQAVKEVFDTGWLGEGAYTDRFEERLREYTGAPHVVAVNTGTSALHLALFELGVKPGDEVILPSFTFASDAMAVWLCGATPVFGDIDPNTLNLDPAGLESLITSRTRAIMPTDYAGLPADVPAIRSVVGDRDIRIIRDASHSFGSRIDGRLLGNWCGEDATCFSFDPIKNITCGEGGAILLHDATHAQNMIMRRRLGFQDSAWMGLSGGKVQDRRVSMTGFRYHLSNVNAAIGLAQMDRAEDLVNLKRAVARRYDKQLSSISGVRIFQRDYADVAPFIYPIRVDAERRDALITHLGKLGIHSGLRYFPCHLQPLFENNDVALPVTETIVRELICLPIYSELTEGEVDEVANAIEEFFDSALAESTPPTTR